MRIPAPLARSGLLALVVLAHVEVPGNLLAAQDPPKSSEARTMDPGDEAALEAWARERLLELGTRSRGEGLSPAESLEHAWALYFLSVGERDALEEAEEAVSLLTRESSEASPGHLTAEALGAALEVVRAKHARWPPNKLKHLRNGLDVLDRLAEEDPDRMDVRYLRLASTYFLPFFLSREETVAKDMEALIRGLPRDLALFPAPVAQGVVQFVLLHGEMTAEERARLQELVALDPYSSDPDPTPGDPALSGDLSPAGVFPGEPFPPKPEEPSS